SPERPAIRLRLDQIARILGIEIDRATSARILRALGLEPVAEDDASLTVRPPSWRSDLEREIDLVEEVARVHGYEHIPEDRPVPMASAARGPRERVEDEVRGLLAGLGFDEAVTYSLVADDRVSLRPDPDVPPIRVQHSSRPRDSGRRHSLLPSLLPPT